VTERRSWTVYIIQAESGQLYTGITLDLERRLAEHRDGSRGAKFFRTSSPKRVVYQEQCRRRNEALRREREIKDMTRAQKLELIGWSGG
jgi:putative endonuclease